MIKTNVLKLNVGLNTIFTPNARFLKNIIEIQYKR